MGATLRRLPLHARNRFLKKIIAGTEVQFGETFEIEGQEMYRQPCKIALEGIVSKVRDSRYNSGRGNDWTFRQRETLPIAGFALAG
jgi:bifunctional non-homologous end joining protein LigD